MTAMPPFANTAAGVYKKNPTGFGEVFLNPIKDKF
jgi:hypothetical protein